MLNSLNLFLIETFLLTPVFPSPPPPLSPQIRSKMDQVANRFRQNLRGEEGKRLHRTTRSYASRDAGCADDVIVPATLRRSSSALLVGRSHKVSRVDIECAELAAQSDSGNTQDSGCLQLVPVSMFEDLAEELFFRCRYRLLI